MRRLLERYNKCIAAGGDYFEGGLGFHVCTINKSALMKKVWKLIECPLYRHDDYKDNLNSKERQISATGNNTNTTIINRTTITREQK